MAKSLVEKYEQILAQDPASTVFVELAKALIEKGDNVRAIEVCQAGLGHHATSVVGRVLWGKALISLGKPAEAMEQFDKAIAIDRDNPHAYNLIGEVLLHKGLYRSALPLLKKAVALQPNEGRVRQWLEQTQAALAGGPAPILREVTKVDGPTEENQVLTESANPALVQDTVKNPTLPADRDATEVSLPAYVPASARNADAAARTPDASAHGGDASAQSPSPQSPSPQVRASGDRASGDRRSADRGSADRASGERASGEPASGDRASGDRVSGEGASGDRASVNRRPSGEKAPPPVLMAGPGAVAAARASGVRPGIPVLSAAPAPAAATESAPAPAASGSSNPAGPLDANGDDPFGAVPKRTSTSEDVIGGLTATFNALAEGAPDTIEERTIPRAEVKNGHEAPGSDDPFEVVSRRSVEALRAANLAAKANEERGETMPLPVPTARPSPAVADEPSIAVSQDLFDDGKVEEHGPGAGPASDSGLLGDLPPPSDENPIAPRAPPRPASSAPVLSPVTAKKSPGGGLLGDIPDFEPTSSLEVPKVEVSSSTAEAIAREYERELREKLAASRAQKSFLSQHGLKVAAGGVAALVLIVAGVIYLRTLSVNQGSLEDARAQARAAVMLDTRASYADALAATARAHRMDEEDPETWALEAYARGILFAEHGQKPEDRQAGLAALARKGVKEDFPHLWSTASYFLAEGKARADRGGQLIAAQLQSAEENALAGRLLLQKGDRDGAFARFKVALAGQPGNVRVLVAAGDFYLAQRDYPKALELYGRAGELAPSHPARVLGAAEARLALEQDFELSVTELEALPPDEDLNEDLQFRKAIARGRLLAATGSTDKAIDVLNAAGKRFKSRGYESSLALGQAFRQAGRMGDAQESFEAALKLRPRSEDAREALARVLVERDRPKEALSRVPADPESRRISLARGVAWAKAGEWKRARSELEHTQVDGKFPSEAVIYFARADAADGDPAKAQSVLEKTLAQTKKARGEVLVALGDIHSAKGELDKARARYEEAAKDPVEVEGACAYGRLLLKLGFPDLAVEPLQRAVRRNDSHNEAHEGLVRAYLQTGRVGEGLELATKWKEGSEKVAPAYRLSALALYQSGKLKDADKDASFAIRYDNDVPEAWRIRAAINFAQGNSKIAFKDLERANKLDPKDPETFCEIGHAFLRAGNVAGAQAAFGAALRENKDSPCGVAGAIYAQLPGAPRSALKALDAVVKDAPAAWDRSFAQATKARVLLASGRPKDAKAAADEAVKLAPWSGVAQLSLALVHQKQRDPGAKDAFARAVTLDPSSGPVRLAFADHLARGNDEEQAQALDEYARYLKIGGDEDEVERVEKTLASLKKKLASR